MSRLHEEPQRFYGGRCFTHLVSGGALHAPKHSRGGSGHLHGQLGSKPLEEGGMDSWAAGRSQTSLLFADAAEGLPGQVAARVQLALRHGGLGLRSAARHAPAAFWASWADTLPALLKRDRPFALRLAEGLEAGSELPELLPLQTARDSLSAVGFCWL